MLQAASIRSGAVETALLLERHVQGGLTQFMMIAYFKRAFPEIPLRTLLDAGGWERLSAGGLSDADLDQLLSEWLPRPRDQR